jgi:hypothetical protein
MPVLTLDRAAFDVWAPARVDVERWDNHVARLDRTASSSESLGFGRRCTTRAAALLGSLPDASALEEPQLTVAVAREQPGWRAGLESRRPGLGDAFSRQLDAYLVLQLRALAGATPDEHFLTRTHALVCATQATALVAQAGRVSRHPLPKGCYRTQASGPHGSDPGRGYAAAGEIEDRMNRFVAELRSTPFASAHPVLQASYALHTLLSIHPFVDGNGRVARALASIYFFRAFSLPFFVEASERTGYLDGLMNADAGQVQPLVDFVSDRGCGTVAFALACAEDSPHRHP